MPKTLYMIDSHSHLYASYYAIPHLTAPTGEPTGATLGFTSAVVRLLRDKKPDYLVAVFDGPQETFRKKEFAEYKINRKPMPAELPPQIDRVKEILGALAVPVITALGYEADDVIAKFALEARRDGCQVVIVSRDKDLMQLLGPGVVMFDNRQDEIMDEARLLAEKGLRPEQVADMLGLMGDAADNIPGVPGIGEKRAIGLLQKYGSLDEVLKHADEIPGKMGETLRANADLARKSRDLAVLDPNAPIDSKYNDFTVGEPDRGKLLPIFKTLGFNRLAEEFSRAAGGEAPLLASLADEQPPQERTQKFECVATRAALEKLAAALLKAKVFACDTEATGLDPLTDRLVGLSFSTAAGQGAYVPVLAPEGEPRLDLAVIREILGPALANPKSLKVAHNAKFDLGVLRTAEIEVGGPLFDTMIASYLSDPEGRHGLDALAAQELDYRTVPITDLIGERKRGTTQKTMDQVPLDQIVYYAAEDAEVAWRLYEIYDGRLGEMGLTDLFHKVEMPLVRVLEQVERTGVGLDLDLLKRLSGEFGEKIERLEREIYQLTGHEFNIDSPKQLGTVLFTEAGLAPLRKTKGGATSTDSDTLEALARLHPLPAKILEYRTLAKLKSTYIDALPTMINPATGRIHASFNQAATATGRLSSSDPNLQNIPIRSEAGREIRAAFVPADRKRDVLLTADYSQIELRLLAHFSQDPFLQQAFNRDLDIHSFVASEIFGVPQNEVTSEQRSRAKTVNFSLIYGKTAFGLSRDLGISVGEARDFIEAYFARYTRVKEFMIEVLTGARDNGYIKTILERRRVTPGVRFVEAKQWGNAERAAFNAVLQGSAADLIKVAMNSIARRIRDEGRPSKMILQVHDELVFEVPLAAVESEKKMIVEEMTTAIKLNVPMKVDVAFGSNWLEAK
jgi:DNA polymerase-1